MPHKSPLKRFEDKFGKIKSKEEAQELANKLQRQLFARKQKLLRELEKRIIIIEKPIDDFMSSVFLRFSTPNLKNIVSIKATSFGDVLNLDRLAVGEFSRSTDFFGSLGLSKVLLNRFIKWARMNGIKRITLDCEDHLVEYYQKFGFKEFPENLRDHSQLWNLYLDL
jgi:N-acetylglutamate synthase-like GNAT family acetyltransferase